MKAYKFNQLSKKAKQTAISNNTDINIDYDWWQFSYDDAEAIGVKLEGFDLSYRQEIDGKLTESMDEVCKNIIAAHGPDCDTYKTATEYLQKYNLKYAIARLIGTDEAEQDFESEVDDLKDDFKKVILKDYWKFLRDEYDWRQSDEQIAESLISNDQEFTRDGEPYEEYQSAAA